MTSHGSHGSHGGRRTEGLWSLPAVAAVPAAPALPGGAALIEISGDLRRLADVVTAVMLACGAPDWAGHSLDALRDVLGDLTWLPADGYLVVVPADDLLTQEDDDTWCALIRVLTTVAREWGQDDPDWLPFPRAGRPFRTVLVCGQDETAGQVAGRLKRCGALTAPA